MDKYIILNICKSSNNKNDSQEVKKNFFIISIENRNLSPKVRKIKKIPQNICNLVAKEPFIYCVNNELFEENAAWLELYLSLSDRFKIQYYNKIYSNFMNDSNSDCGNYSQMYIIQIIKKVCTEKEIWTEWLDCSLHKKAFILFIRIKITLAITHFYNN